MSGRVFWVEKLHRACCQVDDVQSLACRELDSPDLFCVATAEATISMQSMVWISKVFQF